MLQTIDWNSLSKAAQLRALSRPGSLQTRARELQVRDIIDTVKSRGDEALREYSRKWDGDAPASFRVSLSDLARAEQQVFANSIMAMQRVIDNLTRFHTPQIPGDYGVETLPGVFCERVMRPIERVGLYIPAGTAPLVSTVLMLGVPSRLAGCPVRILCSPPGPSGNIDPAILTAARLCGIEAVYRVGGAQAIAAMAYGTETIPAVDKIFGPGNVWVTLAKMLVSLDPEGAAMDMPAGPSEVLVVADNGADPAFVAADLLAQAEHGPDSQAILVCTDKGFADSVNLALCTQIQNLSRQPVARKSLSKSVCILVPSVQDAIAIVNQYAPEHLILQVDTPEQFVPMVKSAGSVFLGPWSPESAGDYASGTNHVLPTGGFSRSRSGLSVADFMKSISVQGLTRAGLHALSDTIRTCTAIEGLDGHQAAVDIRLNGESRYG